MMIPDHLKPYTLLHMSAFCGFNFAVGVLFIYFALDTLIPSIIAIILMYGAISTLFLVAKMSKYIAKKCTIGEQQTAFWENNQAVPYGISRPILILPGDEYEKGLKMMWLVPVNYIVIYCWLVLLDGH